MYFVDDNEREGFQGSLQSPNFMTLDQPQYLEFYYHMNGSSVGSLELYINGISTPKWRAVGSQGYQWLLKCIQLDINSNLNVTFTAYSGGSRDDHIAIDDVAVEYGTCKRKLLTKLLMEFVRYNCLWVNTFPKV